MARVPWVEKEECIGCGACVEECPAVFRMDKEDLSECYNPQGATEEEIQAAIDACPVQCIEWKDT
jgi:ferredoxin